jgi:hypothetical protein
VLRAITVPDNLGGNHGRCREKHFGKPWKNREKNMVFFENHIVFFLKKHDLQYITLMDAFDRILKG